MCGILGHIPVCSDSLFKYSLDKIQHRGPDGFGIWHAEDNSISLGHRRLAIIDLTENGKQPMFWDDRYAIVFNGEIYNYLELKTDLQKKGVKFRSHSDTEVLLALYAIEGKSCLAKLNGMWALAIYDKLEKTLFLSRDRMGKKPLFYIECGKKLIFASEMKALYPFLTEVSADLDLVEDAKMNMFCYESTERCLIKGIKRLPAASYGIYRNGSLVISKFWEPLHNRTAVPSRYEEQVEMFKELFIDSCRIRMRSDVQIGTALSGGIDSSATISTMNHIAKNFKNEYARDWQHAYVASFPGSFLDETQEAKKVVDNLGLSATYLNIDPLQDIDKLFYYSYLFEELYITSPIPFIQLYGKIKSSGTTVTLDGHGSDELFGGYPFDLLPKLQDDYPDFLEMRRTLQTINDGKMAVTATTLKQVYPHFKHISKKMISSNGVKHIIKKIIGRRTFGHLNQQLHQSSFQTILPTLLRNYDRYSMINSVEIRMPFLDHRIIDFAFSIPASSKVRNGYTKAIVRDAMKGFFPEDVRLLKRKIGFNSPFTEWLKGPLKTWAMDILGSESFKSAYIIDTNDVRNKIMEVIKNPNATFIDGEQAWTGLMPYIWEQSLKYAS